MLNFFKMQKEKTENKNNRIIVEHVSKTFQIGFKKHQSALERLIGLFSGKEPKRIIQALKDVSFEAKKGEIVGIIGENGSGKSTLLRVIAGIYDKDEGEIMINGKIVSYKCNKICITLILKCNKICTALERFKKPKLLE